ncbi:TetR/AcrR family transcriptional regulator [Nonomuraea turkmeniaca]|uniref:TetR/AcrR family transcriptional regulator n=1 Tax=Nonomuraea turkmeniaca TaxID=103838 RepID=A0A5S4FXZ0_9ACTN|nr:TetR/AcrR family transcriptional regulator [Nonomuraea turkmeniaca]TMR25677.1 TetR/AcrR family transcriptional regulator [Nonomuraea turkmeniaca]
MPSRDTSRAAANRRRILDVAVAELVRDPDASMDQIARAAGVVRRTVYGHFPSREALVSAILDDAVETVAAARAAGLQAATDPAESLARATLAAWQVADRYRLLLALAQRSVTVQGIRERLAPVREASLETLQHGLDQGRFTSPLSARALMFPRGSAGGIPVSGLPCHSCHRRVGRAAASRFRPAANIRPRSSSASIRMAVTLMNPSRAPSRAGGEAAT